MAFIPVHLGCLILRYFPRSLSLVTRGNQMISKLRSFLHPCQVIPDNRERESLIALEMTFHLISILILFSSSSSFFPLFCFLLSYFPSWELLIYTVITTNSSIPRMKCQVTSLLLLLLVLLKRKEQPAHHRLPLLPKSRCGGVTSVGRS